MAPWSLAKYLAVALAIVGAALLLADTFVAVLVWVTVRILI